MKEIKEQKESTATERVAKHVKVSKGNKPADRQSEYVYQLFRQPYI